MTSMMRIGSPYSAVHFGTKRESKKAESEAKLTTAILRRAYLASTKLPYATISMDEFKRLNPLKVEPFKFRNSAGTQLQGYLYPLPDGKKSNKVIVLGHGFSAHSGMMAPLIPLFHELGYNVCLFDFNTHGKSDGRKSSIGYHEADDIVSAMLEMKRIYGDDVRVAYAGHSMGGAAFFYIPEKLRNDRPEAAEWIEKHLDGKIVLDSTYDVINPSTETRLQEMMAPLPTRLQTWLMTRIKDFEQTSKTTMKLPAPINALHPVDEFVKEGKFKDQEIFILHGTNDERAPYSAAVSIRDTLAANGYKVELIPLEGAGHYRDDWQPDPAHPKKKPLKTVLRNDEHKEILRNIFAAPPAASKVG
jgi:pimeloyl-ACP methyl ester carboxylesterase